MRPPESGNSRKLYRAGSRRCAASATTGPVAFDDQGVTTDEDRAHARLAHSGKRGGEILSIPRKKFFHFELERAGRRLDLPPRGIVRLA